MGDAQSAQREDSKDAAAAEGDDVQTEQSAEDKVLQNGGQISEMNRTADSAVAAFNGHCEDQIPGQDEHVAGKEEETPSQRVQICPKEETDEAEAPADIIEMETKQNDINETFRKFFSNIGVKLTVKRGSTDKTATQGEPQREPEELQRPEEIDNIAREVQPESAEQRADANSAQEVCDNDSTTCPTLTEGTSEDFAENVEEKTTETKEEVECDRAASPQDAAAGEEPRTTTPPVPVEETPLKKFFTTGIFSGKKKKKSMQDEVTEKELVDGGLKQTAEKTEEPPPDQEQEKLMVPNEKEALENEPKEEILSSPSPQTDEAKSPSTDASVIIVTETEILSSQEKVPASPMKRFLSGSSLKRLSKKQGSRRSSEGKLSNSGEHGSDHLLSSMESAGHQKEGSPPQESPGGSAEEDSAWASFKKLMTPKKRVKRPSLDGEEAPTSGATNEAKPSDGGQTSKDGKLSDSGEHCVLPATEAEGPPESSPEAATEEEGAWASFIKLMTPKKRIKKQNEEAQVPETGGEVKANSGEQISDHSTEEGKKRKDSSVSWEAVLCGSGRKRSRKTSDSGSETAQTDGQKQGTESPLESSNEAHETGTSSPEKAESPADGEEGSTWKLFKKLVTPKKKAKEVAESKDGKQSDSESTQDDSFFTMKKLVPVRKKTKSAEKTEQVSSDEADKDATSYDEDSETPAVVPLSEFDMAETVVQIQTQADIESYAQKEADEELQQDLLEETPETALPCETEATDENAAVNEASADPAEDAEAGDSSELVSKHQQLSDIPEEGVITETMATLPSVTEEAVPDDTMAEDLIEITSEALTAPEPLDVTTADETEMVSAVSQLSESSKTSGDTTPVPDESSDRDTEALLQQAADAIASDPSAVPACSDEPSSEGIVYTVWNQILKTFGKEKPKEDADLEVVDEDAAAAETEGVSDAIEAPSTEIQPEELDTAEIAAGTVDNAVDFPQSQEDSRESEIPAEGQTQSVDMEQAQQIITENEAQIRSNDLSEPEQVGAQQSDAQTLGEEESGEITEATNQESLKDEAREQEDVESLKDPKIEAVEAAVEATALEEETVSEDEASPAEPALKSPTLQKKFHFILEAPAAVKVTDEPRNEAVPPAETHEAPEEAFEPEQAQEPEAEPEADKSQTETALEDVEASGVKDETAPVVEDVVEAAAAAEEDLQAVPAIALDTEEDVSQAVEKETISEEIPAAAVSMDEAAPETMEEVSEAAALDAERGASPSLEETEKNEAEDVEGVIEPEDKEASSTITEDQSMAMEEEMISGDIQAGDEAPAETPPSIETEDAPTDNSDSLQTEEKSEEISATETDTNEPKEEAEPKTKYPKVIQFILDVPAAVKKVIDESKTEAASPTEATDATKAELAEEAAITSDTEAGNSQVIETEVVSEDVGASEAVRDETTSLTEGVVEPVDTSDTLEAEASHSQLIEKETSEDIQAAEIPKDETTLPPIDPIDAPQISEAATLDSEPSEAQILQKEETTVSAPEEEKTEVPEETEPVVKSPTLHKMFQFILDVPAAVKKVLDEPKNEPTSPTEPDAAPEDDSTTEQVQEPEVTEAVPEVTSDAEAGSSQVTGKETTSEDVQAAEIPEEETTVPPVDPIDTPQISEAESAATLDSEPSGDQILQKEEITISEAEAEKTEVPEETEPVVKSPTLHKMFQFILDVPAAVKKVLDEPKNEPTSPTEPDAAPEDDSTTEQVQEPEVSEVVPEVTLDAEAESSQVVISEDIQAEAVTEGVVEPEPEVLDAAEPSSPPSLDKEEPSEELPAAETEKNEPEGETEPKTKYPKVIQFILDVPAVVKKAIDESKKEAESPEDAPETEPEVSEASGLQELHEDVNSEDTPEKGTEETTAQADGQDEPVSAPTRTSNTEEGDLQSAEKEVTSEDIQAEETVTDETAAVTEGDAEAPEASEAATLDSEPSLLKEEASQDTSAPETDTNEPKEETEPVVKSPTLQKMFQFILDVPAAVKKALEEPKAEARSSSETDETSKAEDAQPEETPAIAEDSEAGVEETRKQEDVQASQDEGVGDSGEPADVPEVSETAADATLDAEPSVPPLLQKEDVPEVSPPAETEKMEVKSVEVDEPVQEQQAVEAPPAETAKEDQKEEPQPQIKVDDKQVEAVEAELEAAGPQILEEKEESEDAAGTQTAEDEAAKEAEESVDTSRIEQLQETEEEQISQVVETVTDQEPEVTEAVDRLDDVPEMNQGQETEGTTQDVQFEPEEGATRASDAVETSGTVDDETSSTQVQEKTDTLEETSATSVENAEASKEPTHEETKTEAFQDAVDIMSHPEDVSAQTSSEMQEAPIACEMELKETTETATPEEEIKVIETTSEVVVMHSSSTELEDNHTIQVEVVLDESVTETKEVVDETIDRVDTETEGGAINEEKLASVEEVVQREKDFPEPERLVVEEQETVPGVSETVEGEVSSEDLALNKTATEVQTPTESEIISSVGNEASASTSSPPDSDETLDAAASAAGIHAETAEDEKATQEAENEKAENLESTERAVVTNQPLDVTAESAETTEPAEQIKPAEDGQTVETMQPMRQTGPSETPVDESGAEKPAEEENEQDVWLDAEEDIYSSKATDASVPEPQDDLETSPDPPVEAGDDHEETQRTEGEGGSESEGEDFAIALEDLELTSIVTKEHD